MKMGMGAKKESRAGGRAQDTKVGERNRRGWTLVLNTFLKEGVTAMREFQIGLWHRQASENS